MVKFAAEAKDWGLSVLGRIIQEIQELPRLNFVSCIFSAVPREYNKAAHVLVALGCGCEEDGPFLDLFMTVFCRL
jgi:hypothetical protein